MIDNIDAFIKKVNDSKKDNKLDLSADEDLSIAIMNLISIEEHFFFTAKKTGKAKYFDLLKEIREMRKELLKKIVKDYEGEVWCISKHLLAASMRLMEVGTKELGRDNKKEAEDLFEKSYNLYSLFWGLNLGVVDVGGIKKIGEDEIDKGEKRGKKEEEEGEEDKAVKGGNSVMSKLGGLVKRAIDCCIE